ncbi:hypothetical protein KJ359_004229 [Pestalotiopsis sp. 9143b]|nr:hypothetical protein KJ359_004229 [Pestalotiopsis sp. 9143b]
MIRLAEGRALFDVIWEVYVNHGPSGSGLKAAALLCAGARMDLKDPATGRTAFETAMEMADDGSDPDCEPLQFLLDQATASTWARDHILEVLDKQLDNMEEHLFSAILIMQHGWISKKARSYVFRGDIEAIELLVKHDHPITDTSLDEEEEALSIMARNAGGCSPLMLAIAAGHRDMSSWFIQPVDYPPNLACRHPETYFYDESDDDKDDDHDQDRGHDDTGVIENIIPRLKRKPDQLCRTCPYGQRSAFDIAVHRGELEIFEAMWDLEFKDLAWKVYLDVPRVYSYGSAMLEWMQLRLGMKSWMKLEMSGQDAWLRDEIQKKLQILRTEVIEVREAWRARAKMLEEKWMDLQEGELDEQMDTDSANSTRGDQ